MTIWKRIGSFFEDVGAFVLNFLSAGFKVIKKNGGKLLLSVAMDAVLAVEKTGGGNKFDAAKEIVVTRLKSEGVPIVLNAVNIAIELAVAKMNENK